MLTFRRLERKRSAPVFAIGLIAAAFFVPRAFGQYIDDLHLVDSSRYEVSRIKGFSPYPGDGQAHAIGNLGQIQTVIDLRGFVPMSLVSKTERWNLKPTSLAWFKVPTKKALLLLYLGNLRIEDLADDTSNLEHQFDSTRFLSESTAKGEYARWSDLAYSLAKQENAAPLFNAVAGSGFVEAEPIAVVFTEQSVFVILSYNYKAVLVDNGQVLGALEFTRPSMRYRKFYSVWSTQVFNKATNNVIAATAPYVTKALIDIGVHAITDH